MKISYCTTCMNREEHLYKTLPFNMLNNSIPGIEVEFIVLDYNSTNNVAVEVGKRFKDLVKQGCTLNVFRVEPYTEFDHAHAKNIAHKLASGDILCNIDADNYVLTSSTVYIKYLYEHHPKFCTEGGWKMAGVYGRVALRKEHFYAMGGYAESAPLGWGNEDYDLVVRCASEGFERVIIPNNYLDVINHDNELRNVCCASDKDIGKTYQAKSEYYRQMRAKYGNVANLGKPWGKAEQLIQYL